MYKTWMEGTWDIHAPYKNPYFFLMIEPIKWDCCQYVDNKLHF